jgi:hypothetical protein
MSVSVSILSLVEAGAEKLVPAEVQALVRGCVDGHDDRAPLLALADRLAEEGDDKLEYAARWMAKHGKRPGGDESKPGRFLFAPMCTGLELSARLPEYVLENNSRWMIQGTWLNCVAQVALRLDLLRDQLDVSAVRKEAKKS